MSVNIIHIGYPKTATTWFQRSFYPFVRNFNLVDREFIKQEFIFKHALIHEEKKLEVSENNQILCEEMIIGSIQNGGIHGLLTEKVAIRLKKAVSNPEIILFIRNQPELIQSSYLQYLRTGGNFSLSRFLFPKRKLNLVNQLTQFDFSFFEFDKLFEFYQSVFGEEKVHIFLYEELRENPQDFVNHFARKFNFDIELKQIDFSLRKSSFPKLFIPLIRLLNAFTSQSILNKYYLINIPGVYGAVKRLIAFSSSKSSKKKDRVSLNKKILHYVNNYYSRSNSRLVNIIGEDRLLKYKYPL